MEYKKEYKEYEKNGAVVPLYGIFIPTCNGLEFLFISFKIADYFYYHLRTALSSQVYIVKNNLFIDKRKKIDNLLGKLEKHRVNLVTKILSMSSNNS